MLSPVLKPAWHSVRTTVREGHSIFISKENLKQPSGRVLLELHRAFVVGGVVL